MFDREGYLLVIRIRKILQNCTWYSAVRKLQKRWRLQFIPQTYTRNFRSLGMHAKCLRILTSWKIVFISFPARRPKEIAGSIHCTVLHISTGSVQRLDAIIWWRRFRISEWILQFSSLRLGF